ncbi:DeoR family transcriptional regulator [Sinorhizobium meliloti]|uniref:DeoR family transcriptional regulator n=1 Tax=Rhizobium meliloti TaxID=382 RepID=UPI003F5CF72E
MSIAELAAYFDVSRETIHRDMKLLADRGQLDVVHGGAHCSKQPTCFACGFLGSVSPPAPERRRRNSRLFYLLEVAGFP